MPPGRSATISTILCRLPSVPWYGASIAGCQGVGAGMLEHLLEVGSSDLPKCACGKEMLHERTQVATSDSEIRIFRCPDCHRELRLTVWSDADK